MVETAKIMTRQALDMLERPNKDIMEAQARNRAATLPQLKADLCDHGKDYVAWYLEQQGHDACQADRDEVTNRWIELERLTTKAWRAVECAVEPTVLDADDMQPLIEAIVLTHTQYEPRAEYYEAGIVMRATRVLMAGGEV